MIVIINYYVFAECIKFHNVSMIRLGPGKMYAYYTTHWLHSPHTWNSIWRSKRVFIIVFSVHFFLLVAVAVVVVVVVTAAIAFYFAFAVCEHSLSVSFSCVRAHTRLFCMSMLGCNNVACTQRTCIVRARHKHHKHVIFGIISEQFCPRLLLHGRASMRACVCECVYAFEMQH